MSLGIDLKGLNAIFQKDFLELVFVFLPQIVLMLILFGYMDFLIFVKWATRYDTKIINVEDKEIKVSNNYFAPDIKSYLMNIFLRGGGLPEKPGPLTINGTTIPEEKLDYKDWKLLADREFLEQLHLGILFFSLVCVILMLLPKIFFSYSRARKKANMKSNNPNCNNIINDENQAFNEENEPPQKEIEQPVLSNFIVESAIETIEFVLGTVSNTASYLRLWALSLAHSQLAKVFFSKTVSLLGNAGKEWPINSLLLIIVFPIFVSVTAIVLLFMDMMECFLHTLRLHWVEFQNKFYKADGYQFHSFCFSQNLILQDDEFKD